MFGVSEIELDPRGTKSKLFFKSLTSRLCDQMRKSLQLSLIAVFAALHVVLYFVSFGLWRNWGIYLEAIEGIILGLRIGFLAAFFGSSIA